MGYFSGLQIDIMDMARNLGDARGQDADTILIISRVFEITPQEVEYVLSGDCDIDPEEYADAAADEDAIHYGHA